MIEKIVQDYLNEELNVTAHMSKPKEEPKRYVLIEKTGSSEEDHINSATIVIQSYAESKYEAARLNEQVKEKMNNIVRLDSIGKSKLNTDYNFTDTTTKKHRYQAVYDVFY